MHSSILRKINLGNMFAGYPPWGSILHLILKIMTSDYINYKSSPQGTYHLGNDDSKWKNKAKVSSSSSSSSSSLLQQPQPQQKQEQQQKQKYYYDTIIKNCPSKLIGNHPYTYLNTINCGLLWSMKTNNNSTATLTDTTTSINNNDYGNDNDNDNVDTDKIIRIPNFVQSGYEETYLKSKYYNSRSSK